MFGFGKKQELTQVSQSTTGQLLFQMTEERDSYRRCYESAMQSVDEKETARAKAVAANHDLQKGWKEALAEVERLTACVTERDGIIVEHADRIAVLTETVRLAELNLASMQTEIDGLKQDASINADYRLGENQSWSQRCNAAESKVDELEREIGSLKAENERLSKTLRETHLALMSVIDEMECPDDDRPSLGNAILASMAECDSVTAHACCLAAQQVREQMEIERKINGDNKAEELFDPFA